MHYCIPFNACGHAYVCRTQTKWATAGVYNNSAANSIAPRGRMQLYAVHHLLAASVSIFHRFLRPFGVALTEETVREVAQMDRGSVRQELYDIYGHLVTVATKTYQLVRTYHRRH